MENVLILNLIIIFIYLINAINGYRKGFLYSFIKFIALFLNLFFSFKLARIYANSFNLSQYFSNDFQNNLKILNITIFFNTITLFLLFFIVLSFISFIFIKIINKIIMKTPLIANVNKILGLLLSVIYSTFLVLIIGVVLNMPFITNGKQLQSKSIIAPIGKISEIITKKLIFKISDVSFLIDQFINQVGDNQDSLIKWLKKEKIESRVQFENITNIPFESIEIFYGLKEYEVFVDE